MKMEKETVYRATIIYKDRAPVVFELTNLWLSEGDEGDCIDYEVVYQVSEYPQVKDIYPEVTDKDFIIQENYIPPMEHPIKLENLGTFRVYRPSKGESYETYNNIKSNQLLW